MGRAWVPEAKEVQDATICWQGDGHSILGRKRHYYVGLFTQEKYNNWSVLCKPAFLLHLVTVDETWVHYYEPENKGQSRQWVGPGSPRQKKFKTQPFAGKVMATVFWDAKGIIMLDFLLKRSTITGVYYANQLFFCIW